MEIKKKLFYLILINLLFVLIILNFMFFSLIIGYKSNVLSNRLEDYDNDGIINVIDDDVDGDGIINIKDDDADGDGIKNIDDILRNITKFRFRIYDQLCGEFYNIGYLLGGMVCIDIILQSFEQAGIYLSKELNKLYFEKPQLFKDRSWNNPYDKNFSRRVKNLLVYFKYNKMILSDSEELQPGDIIIFSDKHIAMIEKVEKDDYIIMELAASRFFVRRTNHNEILIRNIKKYGPKVNYVRVFR